jgi:hypothetical protein
LIKYPVLLGVKNYEVSTVHRAVYVLKYVRWVRIGKSSIEKMYPYMIRGELQPNTKRHGIMSGNMEVKNSIFLIFNELEYVK